jgi:hypothetical protein
MLQKLLLNTTKRKSVEVTSSIELLTDLLDNKTTVRETIKNLLNGKSIGNFRSVLWKICLQILPNEDSSNWEEILRNKREDYYKKCNLYMASEFTKYIYSEKDNKQSSSPKLYLYDDCETYKNFLNKLPQNFLETLSIIKLDVDRTFQEIDLFRDKKVKETLSRILYVWTLENKDLGYCQGMNEILGTLYYALYPSNVIYNEQHESSNKPKSKNKNSSLYYMINSEENFEADLYLIFYEIMKRDFKDLYNYNDVKYREHLKHGLVNGFELIDKTCITLEEILDSQHSSLKKRINKIFYFYLKIIDKELFLYLQDKVEPYIFLFRWVLCLLNREIQLKDILHVWDCIIGVEYLDFCKTQYTDINEFMYHNADFKTNFNFLDFMCVSMIRSLKSQIMQEDDVCLILSSLMNFPSDSKNIKDVIKDAMMIRDKVYEYFKINNEFVIID